MFIAELTENSPQSAMNFTREIGGEAPNVVLDIDLYVLFAGICSTVCVFGCCNLENLKFPARE